MKKFSTAALIPALATTIALLYAPAASAAGKCEFLKNAPDKHTIVKGDTLWGISGKFLEHPWCWPQVWGMNKAQIHNPHWIYPGQIVYLDRAAGRLRLGTPTGSGAAQNGTSYNVRLSPRVRSTPLDKEAVPTIAEKVIEPFLTQALIIEGNEFDHMPRIVAATESHVNIGRGDRAYVRGNLDGHEVFQVFRPAIPLKDPDSKKILGYEAAYLGTAKLVRAARGKDEAHAFTVTDAKQEMGVGDYLVPMPPKPVVNYVPHPPEEGTTVRVVSIYGGVMHAGQYQAVSINRGKDANLDVGTVLTLYRTGQVIADRTNDKHKIRLPDEKYGTLFVFRVFNRMSYALIMEVTDTVQVGDTARAPE